MARLRETVSRRSDLGAVSERFYPSNHRDAQIEEFFILEQGSTSIMNYERRFSELIHLVPLIAKNEEQKCKRSSPAYILD